MAKLSIADLDDLRGKLVFVRVDYNVPIEAGQVGDDKRIRATVPTIDHLVKGGARIVLASHLGRPKGTRTPDLSLRPVAARLSALLGRPVQFATDCVGNDASEAVGREIGRAHV